MYYASGGLLNSPYIWTLLVTIAIGALSQFWINSQYKRYDAVPNSTGLTGEQAARRMLDAAGSSNITIEKIGGRLTDHYDPGAEILRLSQNVYDGTSVASVAVGAHEAGHALQHARGYVPARIRASIVPAANIGSQAAPFLIILGFFLNFTGLMWMGIVAYGAAVLFQIVTLPVELDASHRALHELRSQGIVVDAQVPQARAVLSAAAWTYVAAALVSVIYLLYYLGLARRD